MPIIFKYLLLLRGVVMVGQLAALLTIDRAFGVRVPWAPVGITLFLLGALTLHSAYRLGGLTQISAREFLGQLLADVVALSLLVFFTGGSLNPFISLFLLPIIFAAAALPSLHTAIVGGAAAAAYTTLMFVREPVDHHHAAVQGFDLHLWGMWYGFLLSAACVAAFVARIAGALRERDAALAEAREQALRSERVIALGTLAAGTAHELGTPLATMAILAQDLATDLANQPTLHAAVTVLQGQLDRCKATLSQLAMDAGQTPAQEGFRCTPRHFIEQLREEFETLNPGVNLHLAEALDGPDFFIVPDRTLRQALLNILNNAAQASPAVVELVAHWNEEQLSLEIRDEGPGITRELRNHLGRAPVPSDKESGLGLGLYLAVTTLQRQGGVVEFRPRDTGGTQVMVKLPLGPIRAGRA
jgi:two-component system sensor histidine kinase RegB